MTKRYLFILALSSFILTVIWLVTNAYHSNASSTIDPVLKTKIEPIDPGFDKETIIKLRNRTTVEPVSSSVAVSVTEEAESQTLPAEQSDEADTVITTPTQTPTTEAEETTTISPIVEEEL